MFSSAYICICIYCMLQLGFLIQTEYNHRNTHPGRNRYFLCLLLITFFAFIADIISSFQADSTLLVCFISAGNYIEIILVTTLVPIFFYYVCSQVYKPDRLLVKKLKIIIWAMVLFCIVMGASNIFTGLIFYYDEAYIYHRGPLFALPMVVLFFMMMITEVFIFSQREKIESHYFNPLAFFLIPPIIGWLLQLFIFGLPFSLLGITFTLLIIFINIQSRNMDQDYLTGLYNRQALDTFLQKKINDSSVNKTFSAILLDIDGFKSINDHYGHIEGDNALINTAEILRNSLKFTDFIARYGGDEFCIILDNDDPVVIESIISRIEDNIIKFNVAGKNPYQLEVSIGYAIYNLSFGNNTDSFLRIVDEKLYEKKNAKRRRAEALPSGENAIP